MKYIGLFSRVGYAMGDATNNDLLVKNKEDLQHFKNTTLNQIVIMGRKTVESLPKKLEDRIVVCLTTDKDYVTDKADVVVHSVELALRFCEGVRQNHGNKVAYVCGGAEILSLFSQHMSEMIVTSFHKQLSDFDHVKEFVLLPSNIRSYLALWNNITVRRENEFDITHYYRELPSL